MLIKNGMVNINEAKQLKNPNFITPQESTTFFQVYGKNYSHNHNPHTLKEKMRFVGYNDTFYKASPIFSSFLFSFQR
jgi:hypothetical protein